MEKVHSFEQRSISEIGHEHDLKQNRIIISNRRDSKVDWSTQNQPIQSSRNCRWLMSPYRWLSSHINCRNIFAKAGKLERLSKSDIVDGGLLDEGPFPSNEWLTSKYTFFNFIPKNLFEQFRRLANFYFLIMAILQFILPYSPVGPATSLLPLLFVVCTSAIKQAYEDYLRHKLDKEVNNRLFHVLRDKKLTKVRSKDIRVGDIVYVRNNEEIPCDMILLAVSGQGDKCYITTANLDGETSLKGRTCYQIKDLLGPIERLDDTLLAIECERPNPTLYEFNGYLRAPKDTKAYNNLVSNLKASKRSKEFKNLTIIQMVIKRMKQSKSSISPNSRPIKLLSDTAASDYQLNSDPPCHEIPLDIGNLLLRASRLRNTGYIYGMAVYTGKDTKLAHNSQVKPNKFSSLENKVNIFLSFAFVLLIGFSLLGAILFERPLERLSEVKNEPNSFGQVFMAYFLLYNYLVPISLYVTLEFVKFLGTMSVMNDKKMKVTVLQTLNQETDGNNKQADQKWPDKKLESPITSSSSSGKIKVIEGPRCNSSDLNEELGQVEVLFSDKTGTLTENKMRFMACSFYGQLFRSINGQLYLQPAELYKAPIPDVVKTLEEAGSARHATMVPQYARAITSHQGLHEAQKQKQQKSLNSLNQTNKPFDHRVLPPLDKLKLISNVDQYERIAEFFICLCLCSTITLNESLPLIECLPDRTLNEYDFQSASPDEESLISAAHQYGIKMCKSNDKECFIVFERSHHSGFAKGNTLKSSKSSKQATSAKSAIHQVEHKKFFSLIEGKYSTQKYIVRHFERLVVFEFSSARKRMSVIYRDCDSDCILMVSKGSEELLECINLTKLTEEKERHINITLAHFEAFAISGLRTLLVARRILDEKELEKVEGELKEARMSIQNREQMMNRLYQRVEVDLDLIGATAVEDTLQDGVPEMIASLKEAGIKVWLLTGDKVETAISVAYLCKLLDRDMTLFHLVRQQDAQACKKLLASFNQQLREANRGSSNQLFNGIHIKNAAQPDVYVASKTIKSLRLHSSTKSPKSKSSPQSPKSLRSLKTLRSPRSPTKSKATFKAESQTSKLSIEEAKKQVQVLREKEKFALVADGRSLYYAMKYARDELAQLCKQCTCVLGCRLSPLQKSEVVYMIKHDPARPITAAIGDGANDVSMIQEAHVGIGVSGKEGRQAINSSDFAISRFSMLNRLFFIHGHLFYHRTANTIHYFFYKNLLFVLPQFLHSLYNLSKVASLYQPILLISFNLFFTSLPVLLYGLFEMHIPETVLENYPNLYKINRHNKQMSLWTFFTWLCVAFFQASIGFYTLYYNWNSPFLEAGKTSGINGFALIIYFSIVITVTIKLYFLSNYHTVLFNISSLGSVLLLPIFFYVYSLFDWTSILDDNSFYGAILEYLSLPIFWIVVGVTTVAAILPDIIWYIRNRILYFRKLNALMKVNNLGK